MQHAIPATCMIPPEMKVNLQLTLFGCPSDPKLKFRLLMQTRNADHLHLLVQQVKNIFNPQPGFTFTLLGVGVGVNKGQKKQDLLQDQKGDDSIPARIPTTPRL